MFFGRMFNWVCVQQTKKGIRNLGLFLSQHKLCIVRYSHAHGNSEENKTYKVELDNYFYLQFLPLNNIFQNIL